MAESSSGSIAQQLAELAALHQQGHLSDEEFSAAKAQLLGLDRPSPEGLSPPPAQHSSIGPAAYTSPPPPAPQPSPANGQARGLTISAPVTPERAREAVVRCATSNGWSHQWLHPWMLRLEHGSDATDLLFGPFMPHQVVQCEIVADQQASTIVLQQTQARWYGGNKTEPRKARRQFDQLATSIARDVGTSFQPPAPPEPFHG